MPGDRGGEDPRARESIDIMVGMILAENEPDPGADKAERDMDDRREAAWETLEIRLRGLLLSGDLSHREYDQMRGTLKRNRAILRDMRKKEEARRAQAAESWRKILPAPPKRKVAFDIARAAARRADGEDVLGEVRPIGRAARRKLARLR